jgi:hypothetical protein
VAGPIVIHAIEQARAALKAAAEFGVPLTLISAPGAGSYGGVAWFGEIVTQTAAEFPAVALTAILDCGDAPGHVLAAIRWHTPERRKLVLRFTGPEDTFERLTDMAQQAGLHVVRDVEPGLDLRGARDPGEACRRWLRGV